MATLAPSSYRPPSACLFWTFVIVGLLLGACDPSVDVIAPSDQYQYTLFGTLNVATDTQVIRVEPLGDSTRLGAPRTLNATVVLENLDTGTETSLRDSFATVGGGIAQVHNLWTTTPTQPGTRYRVTVRENGETVTTATTETPARPPSLRHDPTATDDQPFLLPCRLNARDTPSESENTFSVRAANVSSIAATEVIYPLTFLSRDASTRDHLSGSAPTTQDNVFTVSVFYGRDLFDLNSANPDGAGNGCVPVSAFEEPRALLAVTAGGPGWPAWLDAPLNDLARPDTFSNVEGGHGFVGGVYTDTLAVPIRRRE